MLIPSSLLQSVPCIQRHASAAWPHTLYPLFSPRLWFEFRQLIARSGPRRLPTSECQLRERRPTLFRWVSRRFSPSHYFKSLQNGMFIPFVSFCCFPSGDSFVYGPGGPAQHACAVLLSNMMKVPRMLVASVCVNRW